MSEKKLLIIDTSVLLYDKTSIHSFHGNCIVLPMVVLDELDKFKEKPGLLGESARYINRFLDGLRKNNRLDEGAHVEEYDITIKVLTGEYVCPPGLDWERNDNKIIASALALKNSTDSKVVVVTKDINLRVKCDALGLDAEDYYRDALNDDLENFTGTQEIKFTDDEIDSLYQEGKIDLERFNFFPNTNLICTGSSQGKSALAVFKNDQINLITGEDIAGIKPKNKEQRFALEALNDDSIPLVSLTGLAGSGKTYLSLMVGIEAVMSKKYERLVVTRNINPVGKDIGFLPGDVDEKMAPWMAPLIDNFRHHFKDKTYFEMMLEKGVIEIAPLSFIRGRTFNNCYIIVDEAQNTTIHELKTIITRIGEDSKIVLMGDTDQIDTPYIDKNSNGLSIAVEKLKNSNLTSHVQLQRGERSDLATFASKVL